MILGDKRLKELHRRKAFEDMNEAQINPASVNITLGKSFLVPKKVLFGGVALGDEVPYKHIFLDDDEMLKLRPGEFVLGTTHEYFKIPASLSAFVQGRSSIGRAGLSIQNAGFVDPGFTGQITLELKNDSPNVIYLKPGYPVGQLVFFDTSDVEKPYCGKYVGQVGATGSRMHKDVL